MKRLLITGGGGYLGQAIAREAIARGRSVLLYLHARDAAEGATKQAAVEAAFPEAGERLAFTFGSMRDEEPFAHLDPTSLSGVVHAAAIIRFNVAAEDADDVNIAGTRKAIAFARRCPDLEAFTLVSSLYATGLMAGTVPEALVDEPRFANHYERSKWASEHLLADVTDLPWRICRVATVMADDESGVYTQVNAVHNTLRLLYYGLISVVPGDPETPVYLVTGQFVGQAIASMLDVPAAGQVYHIAHPRACNPTLGEVLDLAFETFAEDPTFVRRRVMRPLMTDLEGFEALASGISGFAGSVVGQSMGTLSPFAPQLYVAKDFATTRLQADFPGYMPMDGKAVIRGVLRHGVRTRFGSATGRLKAKEVSIG